MFVAIDPADGRHIREATEKEIEEYKTHNRRKHFEKPVRVGEVLIDFDNGPGQTSPLDWIF